MNKLLLLSGALLLSAIPTLASPNVQTQTALRKAVKLLSPTKAPGKGKAILRLPAKAAEEGEWAAQKENMYAWGGRWLHAEDNDLTFDSNGNILTQFTSEFEGDRAMGYTRTTNTYDAHGMVTERFIEASQNGKDFRPSSKRVVAYDPILTDVIISNEQTVWEDGEEVTGNCYHFDITRDEAGNITLAERAVLFMGIYDPTERFVVEYGSDGKAVSAAEAQLGYDWGSEEYYWIETQKLTDVEWVETDGQIYSVNSMMGGRNKLKSAIIVDEEEGYDMNLNMTYGDDGSYTMVISLVEDPDLIAKTLYTPLPNGGSKTIMTEEYMGEIYLTQTEILEYAPNGLILREYFYEEEEGEEPYLEETKGEFFGDDEEKPEAYEYSLYIPEDDEWEPSMRIEFSDYVFLKKSQSAIETIESAESSSDAPAEYYNLQGIKVDAPSKGTVCIMRKGNNIQKVVIR